MRTLIKNYIAGFKAFSPNARNFLFLTFLMSFAQSIFGLVFNLYILKLGYTRDFLGTLGAIPGLSIAALAIPLAVFCGSLPARKSLLASLALSFASMAGMAVFPGRAPLMLFSLVSGTAGALFAITAMPLMARSTAEKERQHLFSFQFAVSMTAAFAGNLASGWLTGFWATAFSYGDETAAAYRATMLAACALLLAAGLPALKIKEAPAPKDKSGAAAFSSIALWPALLVLAPQLIISFGAGMIMPFLNIFFKSSFDLHISKLGFFMALMPLAMAAGGLIGPWLVTRIGRVRAMITFQSLSIPFLATMGFSGLVLPTVAAAFLRTMLMNASWPVYSVFLLSHFPASQHQAASALFTAGWNLSSALSARLSGRLQMDFGFTLPFLITITCYSAATLLLSRRFLKEDSKKAVTQTAIKEELE
ncbi:MAG: MFS transporter [Elusimicrobiales bacterium]|nr:MFS transporter [Elusimicrobiales bacterium]